MPAAIDIFCRWFLYKMQNIWRPGILSEEEILASHADTADRVTNGMTEREREMSNWGLFVLKETSSGFTGN